MGIFFFFSLLNHVSRQDHGQGLQELASKDNEPSLALEGLLLTQTWKSSHRWLFWRPKRMALKQKSQMIAKQLKILSVAKEGILDCS